MRPRRGLHTYLSKPLPFTWSRSIPYQDYVLDTCHTSTATNIAVHQSYQGAAKRRLESYQARRQIATILETMSVLIIPLRYREGGIGDESFAQGEPKAQSKKGDRG